MRRDMRVTRVYAGTWRQEQIDWLSASLRFALPFALARRLDGDERCLAEVDCDAVSLSDKIAVFIIIPNALSQWFLNRHV
jgi:hypothetical protein